MTQIKVYQYNLRGNYIKSWDSIIQAALAYQVDESSIRKAIRRRRKSQGSYWSKQKYANLFNPHAEEQPFPKILVFDIETAPLLASIWRLKTKYVNPAMLEGSSNWWVISWSAKWLFDPTLMHDIVTPEEAESEDDYRVVKSIWQLIDQADIVISHNGINFDHKILNQRWLIHGLQPPSTYRAVDTLRSCRGLFNFPSYTLGYIAKILGIPGKTEHEGFNMWRKSLKGETEALKNMLEYNDQDIKVLEDLYLIIRPWIKNHPNIGVFVESETPVCRICGGDKLHHLEGKEYTTNLSKFDTMRCDSCGAVNKHRTTKLSKEVRRALFSGFPA